MQITNCHVHTFTSRQTPDRFLPWPIHDIAKFAFVRQFLGWLARRLDPNLDSPLGRYVEILETAFRKSQAEVFETVRSFYPADTRFVVLPMDMTYLGAGKLKESIEVQHRQLAELRDSYPPGVVIPFAAVDPRHPDVVDKTIRLFEEQRFRGIKLYPPTGYDPNDPILRPLYSYAEAHGLPVMTHCSRPASVQFRGRPTKVMQQHPITGLPLGLPRFDLLTLFTDPDSYKPILDAYPGLRICLAHFGGAGDWDSYLRHPWSSNEGGNSWLAKILEMIRSGDYPNLWTDISYTVFADDDYAFLLKVLLSDPRISERVLFGSDFYVVESARLEERRRSVGIRAILGEELFTTIAQDNPRQYLGEAAAADMPG